MISSAQQVEAIKAAAHFRAAFYEAPESDREKRVVYYNAWEDAQLAIVGNNKINRMGAGA